jgi:hypothetical protein
MRMRWRCPVSRRAGFVKVPRELLDHPDVGVHEIAVYAVIRSYDFGNNPVFPSARTIAEKLGLKRDSTGSVKKAIGTLERLGFVGVEHRCPGRGGNRYSFPAEFVRPIDEGDFDGRGDYDPLVHNPLNGVVGTPFRDDDSGEKWGSSGTEMGSTIAEMGFREPRNGVQGTPEVEVEEVEKTEVRGLPATPGGTATPSTPPKPKPTPTINERLADLEQRMRRVDFSEDTIHEQLAKYRAEWERETA